MLTTRAPFSVFCTANVAQIRYDLSPVTAIQIPSDITQNLVHTRPDSSAIPSHRVGLRVACAINFIHFYLIDTSRSSDVGAGVRVRRQSVV